MGVPRPKGDTSGISNKIIESFRHFWGERATGIEPVSEAWECHDTAAIFLIRRGLREAGKVAGKESAAEWHAATLA
jgi:hypothetical protein